MKVIFITREGYSLPGARYRAYQFSKELKKYGFKTEVLSYSDNLSAKDGKNEREMGKLERLRVNFKAFNYLLKFPEGTILILQRAHYHWLGPFISHLCKRFPLIIDIDDWEYKENLIKFGPISNSYGEMLTRFLIKNSKGVSVSSHFLKKYFSFYSPFYLPSAVDTELFKPYKKRKRERITLSWIGTIHRRDNIENLLFLINIFKKLRKENKKIFLEIAGEGYFEEIIKKKIKNEKRIKFIGWINPKKVPYYISSIDIGIIPLIQEIKFNLAKSPVKLFEYLACSKPVVASPIGEINYFIKDGINGFLAKNEGEFIEKVLKLAFSEDLRKYIGEEARKTAEEELSLKTWGKRMRDWLISII